MEFLRRCALEASRQGPELRLGALRLNNIRALIIRVLVPIGTIIYDKDPPKKNSIGNYVSPYNWGGGV